MIFLFPRWDMLIAWRVVVLSPAPRALTTIAEAVNMLHERRLGSPKDGVFEKCRQVTSVHQAFYFLGMVLEFHDLCAFFVQRLGCTEHDEPGPFCWNKITIDHQISRACLSHRTGTRHLSEVLLRISFRCENRWWSKNNVIFDVFGWYAPKKNGLEKTPNFVFCAFVADSVNKTPQPKKSHQSCTCLICPIWKCWFF